MSRSTAGSHPGMSRWLGETNRLIPIAELRDEIAVEEAFTEEVRDALLTLFNEIEIESRNRVFSKKPGFAVPGYSSVWRGRTHPRTISPPDGRR